jgi:hypothetical protein
MDVFIEIGGGTKELCNVLLEANKNKILSINRVNNSEALKFNLSANKN